MSGAAKSRDLIPLSEEETAKLMREAVNRVLALSFGTGGAALQWRRSPWALDLLAVWRGVRS